MNYSVYIQKCYCKLEKKSVKIKKPRCFVKIYALKLKFK